MTPAEYEHMMAGLDADIASRAPAAPATTVQRGQTVPPLEDTPDATDIQSARKASDGVILICGSDLTPEPVRWLWPEWLALGKMHILAGAPGQGKTTIAIAAAATVSVGGRWPDRTRCEAGNVLIWSGEDDPADTLLPRLLAAGADRARCHFVVGTRIDGEIQSFDPSRDMAALEYQANRIGGIKLLIVDPVVSAVTGDSHKNTEVRRALQPLVDLASRLDAAALGISHFSKGGAGGDPASRVVGSIAFTAVARVVLVAAKVKSEDGEDRRILARGKSNIGPDDGGFEYHIEQAEPLPGIHASYIAWGKSVSGTARELLQEPDGQDASEKGAVDAAADFVRQVLAEGITPSNTVKAEAASAGVSWASVRRAAESLCVIKTKGSDRAWYWKLPVFPSQGAQGAQGAQHSNVEQVEQVKPKNGQGAQGAQRSKVEQVEQVEQVKPKNTMDLDDTSEEVEVF
jgi:putative DNA primase/helicase